MTTKGKTMDPVARGLPPSDAIHVLAPEPPPLPPARSSPAHSSAAHAAPSPRSGLACSAARFEAAAWHCQRRLCLRPDSLQTQSSALSRLPAPARPPAWPPAWPPACLAGRPGPAAALAQGGEEARRALRAADGVHF